MKVETKKLIDQSLDWVVAKCWWNDEFDRRRIIMLHGQTRILNNLDVPMDYEYYHSFVWTPSTNWSQGGPIIEREHIALRPTITEGGYRTSQSSDAVGARIELPNGAMTFDPTKVVISYGPTSLIAAMRCYVLSVLGDEADVPEELA